MSNKNKQTAANTGRVKPLVLMILDGWGHREDAADNAISQASTPCWNKIRQTGTFTTIQTSGEFVGLPAGQMGNSEVGHMNIGAGRTVFQNLTRIGNAIEDGSFAKAWLEESRNGCPNLLAKRKALGEHKIEIVGKQIRSMFEKK